VSVSEPEDLTASLNPPIQIDEQTSRQWNFAGDRLFEIHARFNHPLTNLELVKTRTTR
jgi:hypothetical protein